MDFYADLNSLSTLYFVLFFIGLHTIQFKCGGGDDDGDDDETGKPMQNACSCEFTVSVSLSHTDFRPDIELYVNQNCINRNQKTRIKTELNEN